MFNQGFSAMNPVIFSRQSLTDWKRRIPNIYKSVIPDAAVNVI